MSSDVAIRSDVLDALRTIQENLPYELQRFEDGVWIMVERDIDGRASANDILNMTRANEGGRWRVLPANEADKYREGLAAARKAPPPLRVKKNASEMRMRRPKRYIPPGGW